MTREPRLSRPRSRVLSLPMPVVEAFGLALMVVIAAYFG